MKIWKVGDKSQEFCPKCESLGAVTFTLREVHLEETGVDVPDVLVSVCDSCREITSIPYQSTPRLRAARRSKLRKLEARIPHHLEDALRLVSDELETSLEAFNPLLFPYYFDLTVLSDSFAELVRKFANDELTKGIKDCRISLRLSDAQWETCTRALVHSGLGTRSALVNGLIVAAWRDVVKCKSASRKKDLMRLASLVR